jgi:hypothetical protein
MISRAKVSPISYDYKYPSALRGLDSDRQQYTTCLLQHPGAQLKFFGIPRRTLDESNTSTGCTR